MPDVSHVFYPEHDRPFRLDGDKMIYVHGRETVELSTSIEDGAMTALTFKLHAQRPVKVDLMQKRLRPMRPA